MNGYFFSPGLFLLRVDALSICECVCVCARDEDIRVVILFK